MKRPIVRRRTELFPPDETATLTDLLGQILDSEAVAGTIPDLPHADWHRDNRGVIQAEQLIRDGAFIDDSTGHLYSAAVAPIWRNGDDALMVRAALLVVGVAFGLVAGPLLTAHGGLPTAIGGGLLAMAAFFSIPWSWWRWAHGSNVAFAAGAVVALMLMLAAFSVVPDDYLKQYGRTGEVVVIKRICQTSKGRCTYWLALAAPDGRSISGLMSERETRAAGDRFLATWDSTGVVGPRPADETSSGPFGILLPLGLAGFLAGTVFFAAVLGRRRQDQ